MKFNIINLNFLPVMSAYRHSKENGQDIWKYDFKSFVDSIIYTSIPWITIIN